MLFRSNGVGIGIPFITYAFGEAGLVPLLMIISVNSLVMLTLCSFLLEIGSGGGSGGRLLAKLGGAALMMMKHPVIPSIFAGLAWAELTALVPGLGMPVVIDKVLQALALAAPPCGLIMLQPLLDRPAAPLGVLRLGDLAGALVLGREFEQPFGGVGVAIEDDVLAGVAQLLRDLVVDLELAGIDDAHVHARLNGVVEKHRVHGLAHRLVAAEGEGEV